MSNFGHNSLSFTIGGDLGSAFYDSFCSNVLIEGRGVSQRVENGELYNLRSFNHGLHPYLAENRMSNFGHNSLSFTIGGDLGSAFYDSFCSNVLIEGRGVF